MPRIKLTIAYVGTQYCGWQTQAAPMGELRSIQSSVMRAVARVAGVRAHVHGAGRTDSGVHAAAQVAHVDVPEDKARVDWQLALNTGLPHDIRIVKAEIVRPDFHAQRDARRKTYIYRLWLDRRCTPPHLYPFVWNCGPLDEDRMHEAAGYLCGTHDFAALRNAGTDVLTSVRTVDSVRCETLEGVPDLRVWSFEADGFLKQMVRNMMGLLVRIGQGKVAVEALPEILARGDRRHGGVTAPPCGLMLHRVWYAEDLEMTQTQAPHAAAGAESMFTSLM